MIRQTDADSGIFHEIPSPSQLLQQQQAIKFAFWDTRTLTFQDIHSPSQLQQQQAIKFAFWVTLKLKVQDIHSYSQLLQQQQEHQQQQEQLRQHQPEQQNEEDLIQAAKPRPNPPPKRLNQQTNPEPDSLVRMIFSEQRLQVWLVL